MLKEKVQANANDVLFLNIIAGIPSTRYRFHAGSPGASGIKPYSLSPFPMRT